MNVVRRKRDDTTWEERFDTLIAMLEEHIERKVPNPEDYAANVVCDNCGRLIAATVNTPPEGWVLGAFGENDFCPDCARIRKD